MHYRTRGREVACVERGTTLASECHTGATLQRAWPAKSAPVPKSPSWVENPLDLPTATAPLPTWRPESCLLLPTRPNPRTGTSYYKGDCQLQGVGWANELEISSRPRFHRENPPPPQISLIAGMQELFPVFRQAEADIERPSGTQKPRQSDS